MDFWHAFDEQGGGEGTQEFGLEGEPYPDILSMDSQMNPSVGMQVCPVLSLVGDLPDTWVKFTGGVGWHMV